PTKRESAAAKDPLTILPRLSLAITKATRLEEIYQLLLEEIVEALDVERASIMRLDPANQVLKIVAARGIDPALWKSIQTKVGTGVSGKVLEAGEPLLVKGKKAGPAGRHPRYKTHSYLVAPVNLVPMQVGKTSIGVINLTDKKSGEPFTTADPRLLTTLTNQAAAYMHLYDLTEKVQETERLRSQMEIARQIQQSLLPKATPAMKGLALRGVLIPAERVSADYFDFFELEKNKIGICVADISGHTVGGALLVAALRSTLRAQALQKKSPKVVVGDVNQVHYQDLLHTEQFLSLVYAEYDNATQELVFTNAGHPPPLLLRQNGAHKFLSTKDFIIGLDAKLKFHEAKVKLSKGDMIVFYTDGLLVARNKNGEAFGEKRLVAAMQKNGAKTADAILNELLLVWKSFIGGIKPKDDVTLVVLKHV
ncbi:MAG: SpoIIE family protein phosphatase, partial [Deltaproteobacteria bacterium]|nr:SpoIIE family protein phosphatase [Deltaproteobacteria bacterium]